jgi:hypothetical protein
MDEEGEHGSKDGVVQMLADEDGVVREERGVEGELDAGDVEAAVLGEGVIAVEEKRGEGECDEERLPDGVPPGFGWCRRWFRRPRGSVMHSYSLDGAGRYNKPRTKKQRHEPMSMNESRKFGMVGAFGMRRSL